MKQLQKIILSKFTFFSLIFLSLLFFSITTHAQNKNMEDVIYLKNGNIIRGTITENKINESVRIITFGSNEFLFQYNEIDKITKEESRNFRGSRYTQFIKNTGFYNIIYAGFSIGDNGNRSPQLGFTFNYVLGYKFHRLIGTGLSSGIDYMNELNFIPVTLDIRGNFFNQPNTPYYSVNAGYAFPVNGNEFSSWDYTGGFVFFPAIGVQRSLSEDVALLLEAGLKIHNYEAHQITDRGEIHQDVTAYRTTFKLGFIF